MSASEAKPRSATAPWPVFSQDEIDAVAGVLRSGKVNYWTGGEGRAFEEEFARAAGTRHTIAVANGTVSLQMAVVALGLGPGDEFVTTPRTFIASVSACVLQGLRPVFADVDPESGNVTAETVERALTPRTRLILPVHLGGWPCDMVALRDLARSRGLSLVEDCAQAHGARVEGRSVGGFGDVGSWSFCQDKILSTGGEGGMLTTNDEALWRRMWAYKDHGKSWEAVYERRHPPGFRWLHETWGTNYRMPEPQAAIGRVQLRKLDEWASRRRANAQVLIERLGRHRAWRLPTPGPELEHAYYRVYAYVRPDALASGWTRDRIMAEIASRGVPCFVGSCGEIYREKAMVASGFAPKAPLPVARELAETSLAFLVHPTLGEEDMAVAADAIQAVLDAATR